MIFHETGLDGAFLIEIEKIDAESQVVQRGLCQIELKAAIDKHTGAQIAIKGVGFELEVGDHDIEQAIAIDITEIDSHSRLGITSTAVGCSGEEGDLFEGAIAPIAKQVIGLRVVGHIEIRPLIVVQISKDNTESRPVCCGPQPSLRAPHGRAWDGDGDEALAVLEEQYGQVAPEEADVVVALGGDGFMLETLKEVRPLRKPVYGMNRGTVGFLMNEYIPDDLTERLAAAEEEEVVDEEGATAAAGFVLDRDGRRWIVVSLINNPRLQAWRGKGVENRMIQWVYEEAGERAAEITPPGAGPGTGGTSAAARTARTSR